MMILGSERVDRLFAQWCHVTTMTRIYLVFPFVVKVVLVISARLN